jgi:DNA polymerase III subunit epsilon
VLNDPHVVFLDTETTGLDGESEVIEIAIVDRSGTVLVDSLVRPSGPIPEAATLIHGISDSDVAAAPTWLDMVPRVANVCDGRTVVVYNAEYDYRLIAQSCRRCGHEGLRTQFHCAMQAYSWFHGGELWKGRPQYKSLQVAASKFALMNTGHRALGDALTCLGVVRGMADSPYRR